LINDVCFKTDEQYLTNQGYPLGTTCWYVRTEVNGLIKLHCAETREGAVQKAVQHLIDEGIVKYRNLEDAEISIMKREIQALQEELRSLQAAWRNILKRKNGNE